MQPEIIVVSGHSRIKEGGGVEAYLRTLQGGLGQRGIAAFFILGKTWPYKFFSAAVGMLKKVSRGPLDLWQAYFHIAGIQDHLGKTVLINDENKLWIFHCHDVFSVLACKKFIDARDMRARIIYTVHALFYEQVLINNPSVRYKMVAKDLEQKALRSADHILCVSSDRKHTVEGRVGDPSRVSYLANSVNKDELIEKLRQAEIAVTAARPSRYFLVPRHLYRVSGVHVAIEAMAILRDKFPTCSDVHLVVAGEGEERDNLSRQIVQSQLQNDVTLLGRVGHQDLVGLMHHAEAVVLPSVDVEGYIDGCPMSMFEAMALQKPIVASRIGGIADVLVGTDAALLVPPGSAADLAESLARLLRDEDVARQVVMSANKLLAERYSLESWIDAHLSFYFPTDQISKAVAS